VRWAEASLKVGAGGLGTTSSGPVSEQHGQRLHEHRRGGGVQRRRLLQPTLNQPQRRIGAGPRALAQATDHLDRRGILGIEGRQREHPQTRVAGGSGAPRQFGETRLDRGRPARLSSRPRPTPCPASRSARAAFPHPSLASSTSVRATCGSTSWSPAGSEPYPIPHAASSSKLTPSTRLAIATLVATPPRFSLSEHGQRARAGGGRRTRQPRLLGVIQLSAHPCRDGRRPAANLCGSKQPASSAPCCGEDDEGLTEKHGVASRGIVARSLSPPPRTPRSCQLGSGCWQDGWLDRMRLVAGRRQPCRLLAADDRRSD
jgi:hypothetical protein